MADLVVRREDIEALAGVADTTPEPARALLHAIVGAIRSAIDADEEVNLDVDVQVDPVESEVERVGEIFEASFADAPSSGGGRAHVTFMKVGR